MPGSAEMPRIHLWIEPELLSSLVGRQIDKKQMDTWTYRVVEVSWRKHKQVKGTGKPGWD